MNIDDARGAQSGLMTFTLPTDAPVTVYGGQMLDFAQNERSLTVAFVREISDEPPLFYAMPETPWAVAPQVNEAHINEGQILLTSPALPITMGLNQNSPNPFNSSTTIKFSVAETGLVGLSIYNSLGQSVRTLVDHQLARGSYTAAWDGRDADGRAVASGMYFYRPTASESAQVRRMVLVR